MVVSQLSVSDLLTLLQVSSSCHRVATTALRKLRTVDLLSSAEKSTCPLNSCLEDVTHAQQVRCVTVKPHKYTSCQTVALPHLPKLNMIRLHLTPDSLYGSKRLLHDDNNLPREKTKREWPQRSLSEVACPLLHFEGVDTVVIVEASDLQAPSIQEILPETTLERIKNCVLFLSPEQTGTGTAVNNELEEGDRDHPTRMDLIVSFATSNTESFTLVYQHPHPIPFVFGYSDKAPFEKAIQSPPPRTRPRHLRLVRRHRLQLRSLEGCAQA